MAACEKCWSDAYMRSFSDATKGQHEHYSDLLAERRNNPCTAEEQAGEDAEYCPNCDRKTVHQHTHECITCGFKKAKGK